MDKSIDHHYCTRISSVTTESNSFYIPEPTLLSESWLGCRAKRILFVNDLVASTIIFDRYLILSLFDSISRGIYTYVRASSGRRLDQTVQCTCTGSIVHNHKRAKISMIQ